MEKEARLLGGKELLDNIKAKVDEIKGVSNLNEEYIHITVSKDANAEILKALGIGGDYEVVGLSKLFGCNYHVSPFLNSNDKNNDKNNDKGPISIGIVVGLFNYAQMLGQWNTFTDNGRKYDLDDLLNNYRIIIL